MNDYYTCYVVVNIGSINSIQTICSGTLWYSSRLTNYFIKMNPCKPFYISIIVISTEPEANPICYVVSYYAIAIEYVFLISVIKLISSYFLLSIILGCEIDVNLFAESSGGGDKFTQ